MKFALFLALLAPVHSGVGATSASLRARLTPHLEAAGAPLGLAARNGPIIARLPPDDVHHAVVIFLSVVAACLALVAVVMLVCFAYEWFNLCRYWARLFSCRMKVHRLHQAGIETKKDLLVCPYCVQPISAQKSRKQVVFLCGHRFHTACSNQWFLDHPACPSECPICISSRDQSEALGASCDDAALRCQPCYPEDSEEWQSADEAIEEATETRGDRYFILQSLHRLYPDIISKDCVQRWANRHTELWLSELGCKRYRPAAPWPFK
eukprot:TRINITY_DN64193_c0_g1_i1.p1 TRINITY_DN64193_c0_g1~~TRINITY_DN64193_c0_g1_i1.p1  ORF type:complete len:297 (-),score=47.41 TRINITY_DN64193_c0_g1_i1:37-834(-)